jgi:hypothetical protein
MQKIIIKVTNPDEEYFFFLPEEWNDLTKDQFLFIVGQILSSGNSHVPETDFYLKVVIRLMDFKKNPHLAPLFEKTSDLDKLSIIQELQWISKRNNLTKNLIGDIKFKGKNYSGVSDRGSNLRGLEFSFADHFANLFIQSKSNDESYLNALCAIVFRQDKPLFIKISEKLGIIDNNGDKRKKFNSYNYQKDIEAVSQFPIELRMCIFLQFIGIANAFKDMCEPLFEGSEAQNAKESTNGWVNLYLEMSGGKFGNFEQTCEVEMLTIITELKAQYEKAERLKDK